MKLTSRGPLITAVTFVMGTALIGLYGERVLIAGRTLPGLRVAGVDVGGVRLSELPLKINQIAEQYLAAPMTLALETTQVNLRRSDAGLRVALDQVGRAASQAGRSGAPFADMHAWWLARAGRLDIPLTVYLDRARAVEALSELKETFDRAPSDAYLDLDRHTIAPENPGVLLQVYESLMALDEAAQTRAPMVQLRYVPVPAQVSRGDLAAVDVSTVLASWETHYSSVGGDSDRSFNLKVGAEHLNGHVLKPHELFSFNEVVGPRTEREGYRVAPVIQSGELVDGLAGGMCQIASTLYAAAFFAGLEIVSSTPHSRPSAYIPLGLDSTVVFPSTDIKLRNPFDFPVVIHYQVNQGKVRVELLGKQRPYKVIFEREISQETSFGTARQRVPTAPQGQKLLLQEGYPGYHAIKRRYIFDAQTILPRRLGSPSEPLAAALERAKLEPIKVEKWSLFYPSTERIWGVGSGSRRLPKKPAPPAHRIPPVPKDDKPIGRIVK